MDRESARPTLSAALQAALALSAADQARLFASLAYLAEARADEAPDRLSDTELSTRGAPDAHAAVAAWLQVIAAQPAWLRLQLLEEAIDTCETDAERAALQAAHAQLLQAHPALAVRRTVTELATLHPARTGIALVGLLLGLAGLARLVLRGLF